MSRRRKGWAPTDLPYLVAQTADAYLDYARRVEQKLPETPPGYEQEAKGAADIAARRRRTAEILQTTELSWIHSDLISVAIELAASVPVWSPSQVFPASAGFIGFEDPICETTTARGSWHTTVDAIAWRTAAVETVGPSIAPNVYAIQPPGTVTLELFTRNPVAQIHEAHPRSARLSSLYSLSLTGDTPVGEGEHVITGATDQMAHSADNQVLPVIGALLLLMGQESVTEEESQEQVTVKRRNPATGTRRPADVRLTQRRLSKPAGVTRSPAQGTPSRKATTRWWVRGHWRQQACGPNRSLRRPVFIAPHTSGALEAPLDKRPRVDTWRT